MMDGPDPNSEVSPLPNSYFDRVLDRCRSYKQSLDQLLDEVDREIDEVVSAGDSSLIPELVTTAAISEAQQLEGVPVDAVYRAAEPAAALPVSAGAQEPLRGGALARTGQTLAERKVGHLSNILTSAYVLSGRYELVKCVASSGCGMLFKALDRRKLLFDESSPYVAVEILSSEFQKLPGWQALLQRAATRLNALVHENVLPTVDFQRDGGTVYVVMEYVRAVTLQDKLQDPRAGPLPRKDAAKIVLELGNALIYAHNAGVAHGDLRPANVLIGANGAVQVYDFGIAGLLAFAHWHSGNGSDVAFLSPDLNEVSGPDAGDDVYSYACICYMLLTGAHPFDGRDGRSAARLGMSVPRRSELNWVQWKALQRALSFDRLTRTATIAEVLTELSSSNFNPVTLSRAVGRSSIDWLLRRNRQPAAAEQDAQSREAAPALEHKSDDPDAGD